MIYRSTKLFPPISCCFRQWRAQSHCRFLHGYALEFLIEFEADELDVRGWVVDFGALKTLKGWIEGTFDHRTLMAEDDPLKGYYEDMAGLGLIQLTRVEATGCEAFAALVFGGTEIWLKDNGYAPRVWVAKVECREHRHNSAIVIK